MNEPAATEATSERYRSLRRALEEMRGDVSAVMSILNAQGDSGAWWVSVAYSELRHALVEGRLNEAEVIGDLIGSVLQVQESGADDELAENRIHRESLRCLLDGIGAILDRDNHAGIQQLESLTEAVYSQESLQWVAWIWISKGAADAGELERAVEAARNALELAEQLDARARSTSLCNIGELEALAGEYESAFGHLDQAVESFRELDDAHGIAVAHLTRARMEAEAGESERAIEAARKAREADEYWDAPVVFLARQALIAGDHDWAEVLLVPLLDKTNPSAEAAADMRLVELVRTGRAEANVVAEFCKLRSKPPSEELVERLKGMIGRAPGMLRLREHLAWMLIKLGHDEEAAAHFEELAAQNLDPQLQSSVLLGLGCLASRRHGHRQPGVRLRAAASAGTLGTRSEPRVTEAGGGLEFSIGDQSTESLETAIEDVLSSDSIEIEVDEPPPMDGLSSANGAAGPASAGPSGGRETGDSIEISAAAPPAVASRDEPSPEHEATKRTSHGHAEVPKAAFTGDLQLLAVPDLLEFLKSSRRTGTLVVTSDAGIGAVHLRHGMITGAASPNCANIGDIMLERGQITTDQLISAAQEQKTDQPDRLLGAILVSKEIVDETTVREALVKQVHSAILEMVGWTAGRFAFEPDRRGDKGLPSEIEVELDTQGVLLDCLREFDEMNR